MSQIDNDVSAAASLQPTNSPNYSAISVSTEAGHRSMDAGPPVTSTLAPSSAGNQNEAEKGNDCENVSYFNRETGTSIIKITSAMFKKKTYDSGTVAQEVCSTLTSKDRTGKSAQEGENTRETDLTLEMGGKSEVWHDERADAEGRGFDLKYIDRDEMEVEEKILYIDDDEKCDPEPLSDSVRELSGNVREPSDAIRMCSVVEQRHVRTTFRPFQNALQLDFDTKQKVDETDCGYSKHFSCFQTRTDCNSSVVTKSVSYPHKSDQNSNWVVPYDDSPRGSAASLGSEGGLKSSPGPLRLKRPTVQTELSFPVRSSSFEVNTNTTSTCKSGIGTFVDIPSLDHKDRTKEWSGDRSRAIDPIADWPESSSTFAEPTENITQQEPKSVDLRPSESLLPTVARIHEQVVNSGSLLPGGSTNTGNVTVTSDNVGANQPIQSEKLRKMRLKKQQKTASGFIMASQIEGNKGDESIEELLDFINGDRTKYTKNGKPPQKPKKSVHDNNLSKKKKVPTATLR